MQALAAGRAHVVPVSLPVVPRLVGVAGFHGRDDMHQARVVTALFQQLGDDAFLADMALRDVFDRCPGDPGVVTRLKCSGHHILDRCG